MRPLERIPGGGGRRWSRLGATVVLLLLVGAPLSWAAHGAIERAFRSRDTPVYGLIDSARGTPLFEVASMTGGQTEERCLTTGSTGTAPELVGLYGAGSGALGPYLTLTVDRGVLPTLASGPCTGFASDGPVLYSGPLSSFPTAPEAALKDPTPYPPSTVRTYRFRLTLANDNAAQGRSVTQDFSFGVGPVPGSVGSGGSGGPGPGVVIPPGSSCQSVTLGKGGSSRRNLIKSGPVRGSVYAILILRVLGLGGRGEHLVLETGLRSHGYTLLIPGFAHVAYSVNHRRVALSTVRPFYGRVKPGVVRAGTNVVTVKVIPRGGRSHSTAFKLSITARRVGGKIVCSVS